MKVTETSVEGLNHEYQIVVPMVEVRNRISDRLKELQQTVRINGFRPGKVPISILRQRYVNSVMGEVLEKVVGETSQQALKDGGVRPALQPKIEIKSFEEDKDLEYVMLVEALPDVDLPDLKKFKFTRMKVETTEAEVDSAVEKLGERNRTFAEVKRKRKSKNGEVLVVDFKATVDGTPLENGSGQDFRVGLGANSFLPGFDEQLIGAKAGDLCSITITLPDNYRDEKLRGKEAVFEVKVKEHLEPEEIKVDDTLAKALGLEDLTALKAAARTELERGNNAQSRTRLKRDLLDTFAETYGFDVPNGMIEREFEGIWAQIESDMERAGSSWEDEEQTEDEARAEYKGIAERRVRLALLLSEVGQENNITVPQEELNQAVMEQARRYPGKEQEVFDYFRGHPEAIGGLHAPLFEDKVVDFIIEMSDISETVVTVEELFQNPDAPVSDKPSSPSEGKGKRSKNVTKGLPKKKEPVKAAKKKAKKKSSS